MSRPRAEQALTDPAGASPAAAPLLAAAGSTTSNEPGPVGDPARAAYCDLVTERLGLTPAEQALLQRNGFVVSDRLTFADCSTAYAYLYWQDLPVLITTDSLLHALHATYDDLLIQFECQILAPHLTTILQGVLNTLETMAHDNDDRTLVPLYQDLMTYVRVPLQLLVEHHQRATSAQQEQYLALVRQADTLGEVELFGSRRRVDWTQFLPRGHYAREAYHDLRGYFRAMMWLAQIDFRLVAVDPGGSFHLQREQLAAALLLRDALTTAGERPRWEAFDAVLGALIGRSDNMTLRHLDQFLQDAQLDSPQAVLQHAAPDELLRRLTTQKEYQQRMTGHLVSVSRGGTTPLPRPISLLLLGQRFAVDSYVMSNLVFDRLVVNGQHVKRALPSPLDVLYALGNDRAAVHLEDELAQYQYGDALAAVREEVRAYPESFWHSSLYTRFLNILRTLHRAPVDATYPPTLQTDAWADKMLHTQLAAWSQARHDSILLVKHAYTGIPVCTYPAGYVEPYPAFYAAIADYAAAGLALLDQITSSLLSGPAPHMQTYAHQYFTHLQMVAERLRIMAEKELWAEPWTEEETAFVKQTAVHTSEWFDPVCAGVIAREDWAGWYPQLFHLGGGERDPVTIADIHTNVVNEGALAPPRVLHVGSGRIATLIALIETTDGAALYVGPALTYYEIVEGGVPPVRLDDRAWRERLAGATPPMAPAWTKAFRLATAQPPQELQLPGPTGSPEQARGRQGERWHR